ncbi:sensor histidine kinase [Larkinella arboricola]|uniref:Histidine kinase n=1 Tax=Larkinella arboricola TaxID=643671 RepID=A0A327WSE6_LARAB|nr:histidine kinase [Larkinella arboricola]RAJ94177.1 histidine kinase [Larkinella arboricola]
MKLLTLRRSVPVLIHILAWGLLGFALLVYQPLNWDITAPPQFWIKQGFYFSLLVGSFYLNTQLLVPYLLFRDQTSLYITSLFVTAVFVVVVLFHVDNWLNLPELMHRAWHPEGGPRKPRNVWAWSQPILVTTFLMLGIGTSIASVQKWQEDARLRLDLEQARVSSELSFLKAQINPHFFFNTLNNIYALTLIDGEASREALHRLSRMMRYVLYETGNDTTMLSKEIDFVQDYIQLMQLRLTDKVTVTLEQPTPLKDVPVAPMLLLPFVENAFKHGVSAIMPSRIVISIHQDGSQLEMKVRNTIFPEKNQSLEVGSGIGLTNTRRRLDLLYPERYQLSVMEDQPANEYLVHLNLNLS